MAGAERRNRVLAALARHGPGVEQLCAACVAYLPSISGVALSVMTTLPARATRYVSDETSARMADMQFTLGEGPCVDAFADGRPVLVPDLTAGQYAPRWPAFAPGALAAGARALFAFPLQIGAIRIGVLDLYRDRPGLLAEDELADALVFADTATLLLLAEDQPDGHTWKAQDGYDLRAVVHQATGMIMVQISGTIAEAFARLRARAYAENRPLDDVAADVVGRRLRFDEPAD